MICKIKSIFSHSPRCNRKDRTMNKWTEIVKGEWKRKDAVFVAMIKSKKGTGWMLHLPFKSYYASNLQEGMDLYEKLRG